MLSARVFDLLIPLAGLRDFAILFVHLIVTLARLASPGGLRSVVAESVLVRHQLLILSRGRKRAPHLRATDRIIAGLCTLFMRPTRILRSAIGLRPSTLLLLHNVLKKRKYRMLFSRPCGRRPGPKGPNQELIDAVVAMKRRNPRWGCPRIAQQTSLAFGVEIDKDVVRRVLARYYRPGHSGSNGPSWLTLIAQSKDSLWSVDLFRCESILLRSHWIMLVMDVFTRRIIGFGVEAAYIDGVSTCRMFNRSIAGEPLPKRISTDHDPLFRFHRWLANLRVREIEEIKSVPYAPVSHPFVERLIGTIRREYLDRTFFWNATDLTRKLGYFRQYYNAHRVHRSLDGDTPEQRAGASSAAPANFNSYAWKQHCHGLFETPIAA